MTIPQGYKQTELGIIPEDWEVKQIRDGLNLLTDFDANGSFADMAENVQTYNGGGYAWFVRATDLEQNTPLSDVKYVDEASYKFLKKSSLHGSEVLIAKRGDIGKVYLFKTKTTFATLAPNLYLLKLNEQVHSTYLYYYLKSINGQKALKDINASTSLGALYKEDVKNLYILYPPITEQRAIAEALSDVDGLIAALDKKIAKKRLLKQGAMQQLLTGKKRLTGFTDEWVDTPIGEGVRFQVGYPFQSQYFTSDRIGKRLVKNRDLKSNDQIVFYNGEYEHKFIVHNEDILIGMDGDFLPYKWDKGIALLNQRVGRLLPTKKWDLSFVMYALIEPLQKLQDGTGATTVKHLSHNDIEQMVLCIPQNYEEQQAIATILSDMDKEIANLEAQRNKYRLLKSGMMQKLLTGQIRLKTE